MQMTEATQSPPSTHFQSDREGGRAQLILSEIITSPRVQFEH